MTPNDALIHIDGSYYKFGTRGMVFIFGDDEWLRSTREEDDVLYYWKKEFMSLLKKHKNASTDKLKKLTEEHKEKMMVFVDSGKWKTTTTENAMIEASE